jgi:hypothetical protein
MPRFSPMGLIDVILNVVCVLLWINWRSLGLAATSRSSALTLISTLKKAEPARAKRWLPLLLIPTLLVIRAFFYWDVGSALNWVPNLELGVVSLSFRSDYFGRILLFSFLSFSVVWVGFYAWLLLMSLINRNVPTDEPFQRLVRLHLGWMERWPVTLRLLLPMLFSGAAWGLGCPFLVHLGLVPSPVSASHIWQQAFLVGLSSYLAWKLLLLLLCLLYLVNSYVYLGNSSFWQFINLTGANLLRPLRRFVCVGKVDLSPVLGILVVLLAAHWAGFWLPYLYQQLPLR